MQMSPFYHTAPIQLVQNLQHPMSQLFPSQTIEYDYILKKQVMTYIISTFFYCHQYFFVFKLRKMFDICKRKYLPGLMTFVFGAGMMILSSPGI